MCQYQSAMIHHMMEIYHIILFVLQLKSKDPKTTVQIHLTVEQSLLHMLEMFQVSVVGHGSEKFY